MYNIEQQIYKTINSRKYDELLEITSKHKEQVIELKEQTLILELLFSEITISYRDENRLKCLEFFIHHDFAKGEKLFGWICAHGSDSELDFYLSQPSIKSDIKEIDFQIGVRNAIINGNYSTVSTLFKHFNNPIPTHFLSTSIERSLMMNYPEEIIFLVLNKIGYIDKYTYENAIENNKYNLDNKLHQQLMTQYEKQNLEQQIQETNTYNTKKMKL